MGAYGLNYEDQFAGVIAAQRESMKAIEDSCRWSWHQLLIIGNGFDIEAGLPSRFSDFCSVRKPLLSDGTFDSNSAAKRLGLKKNVWDLILAQNTGRNWCDIEGTVANWVVPKGQPSGPASGCPAEKVLEDAANDPRFVNGGNGLAPIESYIDGESGHNLKHWNLDELYHYLSEKLHDLEIDFEKYLNDAVSSTKSYLPNARALLTTLIKDEGALDGDYNKSASVLSFNYTIPADKESVRFEDGSPISYVNIHGELGGGIVFGIDGTGLLGNRFVLPFTKTYRIMERSGNKASEIVRKEDTGERDCGTQLIKFYGHSLGPADYSYFQSIFDTVNLYGGCARLIFYFKPFGNLSLEAARADMMDKVVHLLDAYGKTLDNVDHGKNLIHKLLLEGRLSVKQLPSYPRCA